MQTFHSTLTYMMKAVLTIIVSASLLSSCNNAPQEQPASPTTPTEKKIKKACYEYVHQKDTVALSVVSDGDKISGTLSYNYFEKDKSNGTIRGQINNDLLVADYTFMSEGTQSTRQVVFKKSGSTVTEGYGDIIEENGKTVFTHPDSLDFSKSVPLKEIGCE